MVGIDIGSTQIKAVEAVMKGKDIHVTRAMVVPVAKFILSDSDIDQDEIVKTLKQALREAAIKNNETTISLMESQVFTRVIETPSLSEKELSQALQWEAERYIPLPLNEVSMDSVVTRRNNETMEVLLVASPTKLIDKYTTIFNKAGVRVDAIENEALSIVRSFGQKGTNAIVVDIGGTTTNLYVLYGENLALVRSISIGGTSMTKAISREHNVALQQAEEFKRTYGLDASQMEGKVAQSLLGLISPLVTEINGSMVFFKEHHQEDIVSKIILTGGGSNLPQLTDYVTQKTGIDTSIGNPWSKFSVDSNVSKQMQGFECMFAVATGLAIREYLQ